MTWFAVLKVVAPAVLSMVPGIPPALVPIIVEAIDAAESVGGAGDSKKKQVMSACAQISKIAQRDHWTTSPSGAPFSPSAVSRGIDAAIAAVNLTHRLQ